jgi:hypothetical protein
MSYARHGTLLSIIDSARILHIGSPSNLRRGSCLYKQQSQWINHQSNRRQQRRVTADSPNSILTP